MTDELMKKRELSDSAQELMDNLAFRQALLDLHKFYVEQMMSAQAHELIEFRASMKALAHIPGQLKIYMNDYKMDQRRQARA